MIVGRSFCMMAGVAGTGSPKRDVELYGGSEIGVVEGCAAACEPSPKDKANEPAARRVESRFQRDQPFTSVLLYVEDLAGDAVGRCGWPGSLGRAM